MASDAQHALEQALAEGLASIQRQLGEVQNCYGAVQQALEESSGDRLTVLLPALLQLETAGAALAASIEAVLRFAGSSVQWVSAPAAASVAAIPAPSAKPAVEKVEVEAPAKAPPPVRRLSEEEIAKLPSELKDLHKKAKRFARVTVQELMMYKKDEVEKGRDNKDLYARLRDEIDKSKALYDQRFAKIAEHNIDYLYEEMVRVLAENDPSALGNYPYPVPSRR